MLQGLLSALKQTWSDPFYGSMLYLIGVTLIGTLRVMRTPKVRKGIEDKIPFVSSGVFVVITSLGVVFINPVIFDIISFVYIILAVIFFWVRRRELSLEVRIRIFLAIIAMYLILLIKVMIFAEFAF